jgi:hypothetical protein
VVTLVPQAHKGYRDQWVPQVHLDYEVPQAYRVKQVPQVQEQLVLRAHREKQVLPEQTVPLAHKDHKV